MPATPPPPRRALCSEGPCGGGGGGETAPPQTVVGPRVVLALSGVNTHPAQRGRGLGKLVVQAAWARLRELPVRGASAL